MFFGDYNVSNSLGKITRDGSGRIIGAEATSMSYVLKENKTQEEEGRMVRFSN